jgi:broad specificity phosphatase PhoE
MKKIYFCRHGLSEMNKTGHIAGITDTPLVKEGREQAKQAGKKAKKLGIDLIVSSPLKRAHETAKIIAKELGYPEVNIHVSKLLLERDFGAAEGHPYAPDLNLDGFSDIEAVDTLIERARLSVKWIDSLPGSTVLVVGHGSFGRALRSVLIKEHTFSNAEKIQNSEILLWRG